MINILVHGLGQNETSWNEVKKQLNNKKIDVEIPNLFTLMQTEQVNYENMYKVFANYCNSFDGKINLVGLSLGGVLAIDYITEFPDKINSLILIGTPYEVPKSIFTIQNIIYKCMPKRIFEKIGINKNDMINLTYSLKKLSIPDKAPSIKCNTLILCGEKEKDNINMKSAKKLNEVIQNSKFKIIENAGYEVNIDNPNKLASVIYEFWNENNIK